MINRKSAGTPVAEGRDEMNLADFPISILDSHQPTRIDGGKVDTVVFEATRYDPLTKRRTPQRVTLLTNSQIGLPTPTDENVVLGLLCIAKQSSNFESPRVHFTPHALIAILRWAPTGKNYKRLRDSLRRLKALTIRYENAWWDREGREYQSEFSTGIIAEYFLALHVRGRRRSDSLPENFVVFSPRFFESLQKGNLKRLDLNTLFSLKLPTSQRMYRFLDKRFYSTDSLEIDLIEFACGHIGMTPTRNVAHLKQRLDPPIQELEGIGFLSRSEPTDRFRKVAPKVWRVQLRKGSGLPKPQWAVKAEAPHPQDTTLLTDNSVEASKPEVPGVPAPTPVLLPHADLTQSSTGDHLVRAFYSTRFSPEFIPLVTSRERESARQLLTRYGTAQAFQVIEAATEVLKTAWPEAKSFAAILRYLPEAEAQLDREQKHANRIRQAADDEDRDREQLAEQAKSIALWRPHWVALSAEEQESIRQQVLQHQPKGIEKFSQIVERFCLLELARRGSPNMSSTETPTCDAPTKSGRQSCLPLASPSTPPPFETP